MKYCLLQNPEFDKKDLFEIDQRNDRNVIKYAYLLQQSGENKRAKALLEKVLPVIQSHPRIGGEGEGIRDVQILSLLGRKEEALNAFREAVNEGFRGSVTFDTWRLQDDPYLDSIRNSSEFHQSVAIIEADVLAMKRKINNAIKNNQFDSLLATGYD